MSEHGDVQVGDPESNTILAAGGVVVMRIAYSVLLRLSFAGVAVGASKGSTMVGLRGSTTTGSSLGVSGTEVGFGVVSGTVGGGKASVGWDVCCSTTIGEFLK